jgi:hypothetical protein
MPRRGIAQMSVSQVTVVRNDPTLLDWSLVEKGISNRLDSSATREHAFHCYLLENVFNILPDAADDYIIDGGSDLPPEISREVRSI